VEPGATSPKSVAAPIKLITAVLSLIYLYTLLTFAGCALISDNDLQSVQGYILYGADVEDLVLRTIGFAEGCQNIVADKSLEHVFRKLCRDASPRSLTGFRDLDDVYRAIESYPQGTYIVLRVSSDIEGVVSIALIPINSFNKKIASRKLQT